MASDWHDRAHLGGGLYDLAWSVAKDRLPQPSPGEDPKDPDDPKATREEKLNAYLALLAVYSEMKSCLGLNSSAAQAGARIHGATYAAIGAARGISRQAVRQEGGRARESRTVQLVGGPKDGDREQVNREKELKFAVYRPGEYYGNGTRQGIAYYRRSREDKNVFIFTGVQMDKDSTSQ